MLTVYWNKINRWRCKICTNVIDEVSQPAENWISSENSQLRLLSVRLCSSPVGGGHASKSRCDAVTGSKYEEGEEFSGSGSVMVSEREGQRVVKRWSSSFMIKTLLPQKSLSVTFSAGTSDVSCSCSDVTRKSLQAQNNELPWMPGFALTLRARPRRESSGNAATFIHCHGTFWSLTVAAGYLTTSRQLS